MKKKFLSAFLAASMIVSSCLPVFAEGEATTPTEDTTTAEVCDICMMSDGHTDSCSAVQSEIVTEPVCEACSKLPCECPISETVCTICGEENCTAEHALCTVCGQYDCVIEHVFCETCQKNDCGVDHSEEITAPLCPGDDTCTIENCENHQTADTEEDAPICTCPDTEGVDKTAADYVHIEGCVLYVDEKDEEEQSLAAPQVGDTIWIKSGSNVYKTQSDESGHQLLLNYEVEIVNIITDETGAAVWYEFKFTSLGIGEIILRDYKYVQVGSTSVEEPTENEPVDENACNCGEDAPENLADHADSCPRKQYVKSLFENKTAEEIYAQWENYDEALRTDLLNMLQKWDSAKYEELNKLVDGTPDGEIEPGDAEAIVAGLNTLESELDTLSYEDCDAFFEEMLDVYANAFQNNYPLVSTEELIQIDAEFDALEEILLNEFGYVGIGNSTALPMAAFSFRNSPEPSDASDDGDDAKDAVKVNKSVSDSEDNVSEFTLTMEAYVTGQVSQIEITQPSDIVLVLDQSASMYTPIGATKGYYDNTETGANAFDRPSNAQEIALNQISEAKASQLGYYIARSNVPSHHYCTTCDGDGKINESTNCTNELYDWFVIHYDADSTDADNDSNETEKLWKFYRIAYTSCPINDTDAWSGSDNKPAMSVVEGNLATNSLEELGINAYSVYQTQYGALYDAINAFVDSMSDMHRVAVVGFASSQGKADGSELTVGNQRGHGGTGIYVNGKFHPAYDKDDNYSAAALNAYYASALSGNKDTIRGNVNAVKTDYYGTNHDLGVELANKILASAPDYTVDDNVVDTNKVIILFTDGVPSGDDNNAVKANTINYAAYAKTVDNPGTEAVEGFGATVYSIWTSTLTGDNYEFLQSASSDNGAIDEPKYAIKVESADALSAAFQAAMQDTSSATITLEKTTVLKDVLTQYFILPDELTAKVKELLATYSEDYQNMSEKELQLLQEVQNKLKQYIKVYTSDYLGNDAWGDRVAFEDAVITLEKDSSGVYRKINVTNFDYSANFVADPARAETAGGEENFYGRKLIVEIPIDPNPDFVGGNGVVTNTSESGIYTEDGKPVKPFQIPDVDVDVLEITPVFQSQDIYISQMANLSTILNLGIFTGEDGETYKIDGINNAYADIVYTIQDPTGFTLTYTIPEGTAYGDMTNLGWRYHEDVGGIAPLLKEDTVYKATCVVTSTQNDENDSHAESQQTVRVFKPVITFHDSEIMLGVTPDYDQENFASVVWEWTGKDENNNPVTLTATADEDAVNNNTVYLGTAPVLKYDYSPEAAAFTALNTPVAVTRVTAKTNYQNIPTDQDITQYATFYRDACDFGCGHTEKTLVHVVDDRVNFVVHMKTFDLTIVKELAAGTTAPEDQTFLFTVTGPNGYSMELVIPCSGEVTLTGLPVPAYEDYTVSENTAWSWRYEVQGNDTHKVTAKDIQDAIKNKQDIEVTFTNKLNIRDWLSGTAYADNNFSGTHAGATTTVS